MTDVPPPREGPRTLTAQLRPRSLGELLDLGVTSWRQDLRALFLLALPFQLGTFVLYRLFLAAMHRWFPLYENLRAMQQASAAGTDEAASQTLIAAPALGALLLSTLLLSWLTAVVVSGRALGGLGPLEGGGTRARRVAAWSGSFWLSMAWVGALLIASLLPVAAGTLWAVRFSSGLAVTAIIIGSALVTLLAVLAVVLWSVLRFLVTPQVLALEGASAIGALRRSGQLLSGRVGPGLLGLIKVRATVLVSVAAVLLLAVGLLVSLPELVLQLVFAHPFSGGGGDLSAIPSGLRLALELLLVPVQAVFAPLYPLFASALYLDLRVRREGLDLERRLRALPPLESP